MVCKYNIKLFFLKLQFVSHNHAVISLIQAVSQNSMQTHWGSVYSSRHQRLCMLVIPVAHW
uniref:Uncharacterized protein n=1 Tax=Arion vulgaris TaxID=1028688 RepID=A0A0B7BVK3_9EUPU